MAYDLGTARGRIELDTSDLNRAETALRQAGRGLILVGGAALAGFGVAVAAAANFESKISHIEAVAGATEGQLQSLREEAIRLGTETAFGASQVVDAFVDLAKAGLQVEDILKGAGDAVVQLAAAGDLPIAQAAEIAVNAMQTFSLRAEDMVKVSDILAGAANASTVEVEDLAVSLKYAGSIAAAVGVDILDTATALAILGNRGIRGSTAGTSLRRVLLNISPATKPAAKAMEQLGIILKDGTNQFFDASGNAKDLGTIIDILAKQTAGLTAEQKKVQLTEIFGARAVASVLVLLDEGKKGFEAVQDQIERTTALDVMEKRLDNVAGAWKRLKAAVETFLITGGSPWQDTVKTFLEGLTSLINKLQEAPPWLARLASTSLLVIGVLSVLSGLFLLTVGNIIKAVRLFMILAQSFGLIATVAKAAAAAISGAIAAVAGSAAAPFILIGLAIIALGLLLVYLYKRFEGFRQFIDGIWQGVQRAWDSILNFFGALPSRLGGFIDEIEEKVRGILDWLGNNWDILLTIFTGPLGAIVLVIRRWGDDILEFIGDIISGVIEWFQKLPGRVVGILSGVGAKIVEELAELPNRIAYILGFILGRMIRWSIQIVTRLLQWRESVANAITGFFQDLPGRIIGFLDTIWEAFTGWGIRLGLRAGEIGLEVVTTLTRFFQALPGRILGFLNQLWDGFYSWTTTFVARVIEVAQEIALGVADWVSGLPEQVMNFISGIPGQVAQIATQIALAAGQAGLAIWRGFTEGVGDLSTWIADAFLGVLRAIGNFFIDLRDAAWEAGSNLVRGFMDGLGISSPSHIERAMWGVVDNVHASAKDLGMQVRTVQYLEAQVGRNTVAPTAPGVVTPDITRALASATTPATTSSSTTFHVDQVVAQDPMTVMRETERRARLNQLVGLGSKS